MLLYKTVLRVQIKLDAETLYFSGGDSFMGKLRSNMLGTQFTIYDGGEVNCQFMNLFKNFHILPSAGDKGKTGSLG